MAIDTVDTTDATKTSGWRNPVQVVREFVVDHMLEPDAMRGSEHYFGKVYDSDGNPIYVDHQENARHERLAALNVQPASPSGNIDIANLTPEQINTLRRQLGMGEIAAPVPAAQIDAVRATSETAASDVADLKDEVSQLREMMSQFLNSQNVKPATTAVTMPLPESPVTPEPSAPSGDTQPQV